MITIGRTAKAETPAPSAPPFPGMLEAMDGSSAVVEMETAASEGAGAYPITSFTWILLYQNQPDAAKGKKLVDFLTWALTEGEKEASSLDYAPLPEAMSKQLVDRLKTVKVGGAA